MNIVSIVCWRLKANHLQSIHQIPRFPLVSVLAESLTKETAISVFCATFTTVINLKA